MSDKARIRFDLEFQESPLEFSKVLYFSLQYNPHFRWSAEMLLELIEAKEGSEGSFGSHQ